MLKLGTDNAANLLHSLRVLVLVFINKQVSINFAAITKTLYILLFHVAGFFLILNLK